MTATATVQKDLCAAIENADDWRELAKLAQVWGVAPGRLRKSVTRAAHRQGDAEAVESMLAEDDAVGPTPVPHGEVNTTLPKPILSVAHGHSGAILSDGSVLVLSGEGGVGKSALAAQIAHGVAMGSRKGSIAGMVRVREYGPVLYAAFEDQPGIAASHVAWHRDGADQADAADEQHEVHMLDMNEHPLYGPVDRGNGDKGFYNQRPDRLPGWAYLWQAANDIKPVMVVIDAATDAYVGDPNQVAPVAAFMADVRSTARKADWTCGVLLVAHATKAARGGKDFDVFNPGVTAGSAAWTDKARGVLLFQWDGRKEGRGDARKLVNPNGRVLSVPKANYGVARVMCEPTPLREKDGHGRVMG